MNFSATLYTGKQTGSTCSKDVRVSSFPIVLTVSLVAERLITSPDAVIAELEGGRLRGFKVGGEWRTTEEDLLAFIGRPATASEAQEPEKGACAGADRLATLYPGREKKGTQLDLLAHQKGSGKKG
jgi:hypothetical protein